jgi:tRNA-binding protein
VLVTGIQASTPRHAQAAQTCAAHHHPIELVGKQVMALVNFPPRQIGKFMSEVLTLGFSDEAGEVVLAAIDKRVPDGGRLF